MHILKANVNGNPNIGLYGFATDKYCLIGKDISSDMAKEIGEVLNVPTFKLNIAGTSLLGVFLSGNDKVLMVPGIIFDFELKKLNKIAEEIGFEVKVIQTKLTALGNNIACNDKGCLVNEEFSEDTKNEIEKILGFKIKEGKIAELPTIGSVIVMNNKGCAIHRDAADFEVDYAKSIFGLETQAATINMGNPFLKSGIIVNSNGFIVGDASGGPELVFLEQVFGFIEG